MSAPPPVRRAWAATIAVLLLSVLLVSLGFRTSSRFTGTLPGAISKNIADERWSAAFNQNFRSSAAADARNSLAICATINGVYIGRHPVGTLRNISRPLKAMRNGECARLWVLSASLTQLHRSNTPPADWWASIEGQATPLADRPPTHGLGPLMADVTTNYTEIGLDPLSARQLATDQLSYTHGTTLLILCELLPRVETSPANAEVLQRLRHNLLIAWVGEDGPIALRLLAAEQLAELLAAQSPDDADALRTWRNAVRTELAARPPTLLGLMARQPTPAGPLQTAWVQRYVHLHWLQCVLYGAAPLAVLGLVLLFRNGLAWTHVVAAVAAVVLLAWLPSSLSEEWRLHSFRLGFPFLMHWPTFGWLAVALGAVVPFALGWVLARRGRWAGGLVACSLAIVPLGGLHWYAGMRAADLRGAFLDAATAPATNLTVISPPPRVESAGSSG